MMSETSTESRRSLLWLAVGAMVGLALAGWGLFNSAAPPRIGVPDGAVARVNQGQILLSDFRAQVESTTLTSFDKSSSKQKSEVLNAMIDEELLVQRGMEVGLATSDPSVRAALMSAMRDQAAAEVTAGAIASDVELRAYYGRHPERYSSVARMRIRHLLLAAPSAARASEVVQALRSGEGVDVVSTRFKLQRVSPSTDEDEIDIAVRRRLGDELFAIASGLKTGDVSEPWSRPDGAHVLVMVKREPPVVLPFEEVRAKVADHIRRERADQAVQEHLKFLRGKAEIVKAPGVSP